MQEVTRQCSGITFGEYLGVNEVLVADSFQGAIPSCLVRTLRCSAQLGLGEVVQVHFFLLCE